MRFLLDAQLPRRFCDDLSALGHEARHVKSVLDRNAPDAALWDWAKVNNFAIMTKDEDFAYRIRSGAAGPQIVWIRLGNCSNAMLRKQVLPLLDQTCAALAAGERIVEIA
jgi:predicted nuclease of predicted toxin-antitoxin system